MKGSNLLVAAAVLAASSFVAVSAEANPVYLGYSLNGGATITAFPGQPGSGSSSLTNDTVDIPGYTINLSATGSPTLPMPNFFSNTLTVRSGAAGSLILYASETSLTAIVAGFTSSFNNNGDSTASVTETSYKDASNTAFGMGTTLSTATLSPGMTSNLNPSPFGPGTTYAMTESYAITFTAAGQVVDATIGVTGVPVPEPVSLALLGVGLVGAGIIGRRKA